MKCRFEIQFFDLKGEFDMKLAVTNEAFAATSAKLAVTGE
jgi:hypothetical protein